MDLNAELFNVILKIISNHDFLVLLNLVEIMLNSLMSSYNLWPLKQSIN